MCIMINGLIRRKCREANGCQKLVRRVLIQAKYDTLNVYKIVLAGRSRNNQ